MYFHKIFSTVLIAFVLHIGMAQETKSSQVSKDILKSVKLNSEQYKAIFNKQFTNIINGGTTNTIGNYLAIDQNQSNSTATAGFSSIRDFGVLGFTVAGSLSGGVIPFVSNNNVSNTISLDVQYHLMDFNRERVLRYNADLWVAHEREKAELELEVKKNRERYQKGLDTLELVQQIERIDRDIKKLSAEEIVFNTTYKKENLEEAKQKILTAELRIWSIDMVLNKTKKEIQKEILDLKVCKSESCKLKLIYLGSYLKSKNPVSEKISLQVLIKQLKEQKEKIENKDMILASFKSRKTKMTNEKKEVELKKQTQKKNRGQVYLEANNASAMALKKLENGFFSEESLSDFVTGVAFSWVSLGFKVNRNSFLIFDSTLDFENQLNDLNFVGYEFRFQYSIYKSLEKKSFSSYSAAFGVNVRHRDNQADLPSIQFQERQNLGGVDTNRSSVRTINALTGDYRKDLSEAFLFGDVYYFLFKKQLAALHLNPNLRITEGQKPIWNTDIGLVLSFKNSKKENTVVNAELFYRFLDIGNTTETTLRVFERNAIGLRLSVPLQFKN